MGDKYPTIEDEINNIVEGLPDKVLKILPKIFKTRTLLPTTYFLKELESYAGSYFDKSELL